MLIADMVLSTKGIPGNFNHLYLNFKRIDEFSDLGQQLKNLNAC